MTVYRRVRKEDLPWCSLIFRQAFYPQLRVLFGKHIPGELFFLLLKAFARMEKDGFIVSQSGGETSGFILVSSNMKRLLAKFMVFYFSGLMVKLLIGSLKISPGRLFFLWRQCFQFGRKSFRKRKNKCGQVIILAVNRKFRRQGLGRGLLCEGLTYLKSKGLNQVQLEVRADNEPALNLYRQAGFVIAGKIKTFLGISFIMTRTIA